VQFRLSLNHQGSIGFYDIIISAGEVKPPNVESVTQTFAKKHGAFSKHCAHLSGEAVPVLMKPPSTARHKRNEADLPDVLLETEVNTEINGSRIPVGHDRLDAHHDSGGTHRL
jgi:hypothetical protein